MLFIEHAIMIRHRDIYCVPKIGSNVATMIIDAKMV